MKFEKGKSGNPAGRPRGTQNKVNRTFKDAMLLVFDQLGCEKHLLAWAKKNPAEYYRIFARITPPGMPLKLGQLGDSLAAQGKTVISKLSVGEITPEQASTVMQALGTLARVVEADDLERRIRALEEAYGGHRDTHQKP